MQLSLSFTSFIYFAGMNILPILACFEIIAKAHW